MERAQNFEYGFSPMSITFDNNLGGHFPRRGTKDLTVLELATKCNLNTFQQICLGKWFDMAKEDTTIKIPMALYLYFICLFGHIIFHICIAFERRVRRFEKKKINRRCKTPITSLGTLGNIWIRNFSFFFFMGGIAIAER